MGFAYFRIDSMNKPSPMRITIKFLRKKTSKKIMVLVSKYVSKPS